jgi:hypothetical protein
MASQRTPNSRRTSNNRATNSLLPRITLDRKDRTVLLLTNKADIAKDNMNQSSSPNQNQSTS